MDRRSFVRVSAGAAGTLAVARPVLAGAESAVGPHEATLVQPQGAPPGITDDERRARIEKARRLMTDNGIAAMFLEGGSSMFYYTGVRWGNSERTFGVVIPAKGELAWVTPAFEEQRARELIKFSNDVRVWQEDESPASCAIAARRTARSVSRSAFAFSSSTACVSGFPARNSSARLQSPPVAA